MKLHPTLLCDVHRVEYDFRSKVGNLFMAPAHNCDMTGCVALFKAIDPKVKMIATFSGDRPDTLYLSRGDEWEALRRDLVS
jgi:hypothetical protein